MFLWGGPSRGFQNDQACTCGDSNVPMENCTCGFTSDHMTFKNANQGRSEFSSHYTTGNVRNSSNVTDDENYSQSRRDNSTFRNIERQAYDASSEISQNFRPTRKRSKTRARGRSKSSGYEATFEDSVDMDAPFEPRLHSSFIDNENRSRRGKNPLPVRGKNRYENNQCECLDAEPFEPLGGYELMNQSERRRRNQLHEMLNEESVYTTDESILEIADDPNNANILGYNYRVNSFR